MNTMKSERRKNERGIIRGGFGDASGGLSILESGALISLVTRAAIAAVGQSLICATADCRPLTAGARSRLLVRKMLLEASKFYVCNVFMYFATDH